MQLQFYHFNKCAGTSVLHFLHNRVAENELLHVERLNKPAGVYETFDKKVLHVTQTVAGVSTPWQQIKLAVFREPIERAYSDFKMVTRWKNERTNNDLENTYQAAAAGVLPFFNSQWAIDIGHFNQMTRTLAGPAFLDWFREVSITAKKLSEAPKDKLLEAALSALDAVDVVLTVDDLSLITDLTSALTQDRLPISFDQHLNTFNTSSSLGVLSPEERRAIASFNELDAVIWRRVLDIVGSDRSRNSIARFARENDTTVLDFGRALPAINVWPRETNGAKNSVWTGNDGIATLYFHKRSNTRKFFNFLATGVLSSEQFEKMRVLVNGAPTPWQHEDTGIGFLVTATIEPHLISASDVMQIAIDVPIVDSPDPQDFRKLGIEISGASLVADWSR
jgi:hypothetical protein